MLLKDVFLLWMMSMIVCLFDKEVKEGNKIDAVYFQIENWKLWQRGVLICN